MQNEVEQLLLGAINQAAKGGQQAPFRYRGLNMVAGVASFNHWVTVKYSWPRIHETGRKFGIPIYEIIMDQHSVKIPLPNTHLPYLDDAARAVASRKYQRKPAEHDWRRACVSWRSNFGLNVQYKYVIGRLCSSPWGCIMFSLCERKVS